MIASKATYGEETAEDYSIDSASSAGLEETEIRTAIPRCVLPPRGAFLAHQYYYSGLLVSRFEDYMPSVFTSFGMAGETPSTAESTEESAIEDLLEHDPVVRMGPNRTYRVRMKLRNVRKAEPRVVEPGELA